MFDLTGKTALVTGATGGIGGAIARAFHKQGATVALSGTRREVLDTFAGELKERVHVLPCNLSSTEEVEALVPSAEKAMGQLDILVCNAGITRDNLFVQMKDEEWDQVIAVNLSATFRLTRAATKLMMRKRFGRLIGITSVVGVTGNAGQSNYTAAKAGMIGTVQVDRAGIRAAQRHRQLHRAGLHRDRDDRCAERKTARSDSGKGSGRPPRHVRRYRGRGRLPCLQRSGLCDRSDAARQRRNGNDLRMISLPLRPETAAWHCWPRLGKYGTEPDKWGEETTGLRDGSSPYISRPGIHLLSPCSVTRWSTQPGQ